MGPQRKSWRGSGRTDVRSIYKANPTLDSCQVLNAFSSCLHRLPARHQLGLPAVMALMGTTVSDRHVNLLRERFVEAVLRLDGDAAGRPAVGSLRGGYRGHGGEYSWSSGGSTTGVDVQRRNPADVVGLLAEISA